MADAILESFKCPICLDLATDAVETECCHQIGCQKCLASLQVCPICLTDGFSTKESALGRRVLDGMPVECPNKCEKKTTRGELEAHLKSCQNRHRYKCTVDDCEFEGTVEELIDHLSDLHTDSLKMKADKETECPFPRCEVRMNNLPKMCDHLQTHDQNMLVDLKNLYAVENVCILSEMEPFKMRNASGAFVKMGRNGKFYCGVNKIYKNSQYLEDDSCGNGGNNCVDCMRLDVIFRNLAPVQLVNSDGRVTTTDPCPHHVTGSYYQSPTHPDVMMCRNDVCGHNPRFYCQYDYVNTDYNGAQSCRKCSGAIVKGLQCKPCEYVTRVMAKTMYYTSIWQ